MLFSARHLPDRTPQDVGLAYSDVEFAAADGVRLRGWFLPAGSDAGPAVVVVHGWLWNRLGNVAGCVPFTDRDVDFLPAARRCTTPASTCCSWTSATTARAARATR